MSSGASLVAAPVAELAGGAHWRRRLAAVGILAALMVGGAVVAVRTLGGGGGVPATRTETSLATVEQRSISSRTQVGGKLSYAGDYSVVHRVTAKSTPTASDVQSAQQAVTSAQAQLNAANRARAKLNAGPTDADVQAAKQAVSSAQAQLDQAQAARTKLDSTSAAAIAAAEQAVQKAQDTLNAARRSADAAAGNLATAKAALLAQEAAYCNIPPASMPSFCPTAASAPLSSSDEGALLAVQASGTPAADAMHAASVLAANTAYEGALSAKTNAGAAVASAQDDLSTAQRSLREAEAGPSAADVASADAAVTAAQQALDAANAKLTDLYKGPTESDLAAAQDSVAVAKAALDAANAKLADAYAGKGGSQGGGAGQPNGTLTALPAVGQVVQPGDVLYSVDGSPVVLLYGAVPAYRDLSAGATGSDVEQLNFSLVALGYADASALDPASDEFSGATIRALKKLQAALGGEQTGALDLGQAVFLPGPIRVTALSTSVGATIQAGATVLESTSTHPVVKVDLNVAQESQVQRDDAVSVTLPSLKTTTGRVSSIGTVATTPPSGGQGGSANATVPVEITLDDPGAAAGLDQAPVIVAITTGSVDNALAVPVTALLALAEGGYAVEVVDANGVHRLVPVTLGIFDDAAGMVQVTGNGLQAGQRVVVPGQ